MPKLHVATLNWKRSQKRRTGVQREHKTDSSSFAYGLYSHCLTPHNAPWQPLPDQISSMSLMSLTAQDAAIDQAVNETSLLPAQVTSLSLSHMDISFQAGWWPVTEGCDSGFLQWHFQFPDNYSLKPKGREITRILLDLLKLFLPIEPCSIKRYRKGIPLHWSPLRHCSPSSCLAAKHHRVLPQGSSLVAWSDVSL